MAHTAVIFGSMKERSWSFARAYIPREPFLTICADGGIRSAKEAGLRPDVLIGDGDSGGIPTSGVRYISLNPEKDFSDTHAAVRYALEAGARHLVLFGCTGGRADHYLANIFLLEHLAAHGCTGILADSQNEISYFGGGKTTVINEPAYHYIGLLPIDEQLTGVTLTGMKYPLTGATVHRGDTICISNEPTAREMTIEIGRGRAFVIRSGRICSRLTQKK